MAASDEGRRPRGREGWVGPLLKATAEEHEPDQLRILMTVREGMHQEQERAKRSWLVPFAAAAAVAMIVSAAVVTSSVRGDGERRSGVASSGSPSVPATTADRTGGPASTASGLSSTAASSGGATGGSTAASTGGATAGSTAASTGASATSGTAGGTVPGSAPTSPSTGRPTGGQPSPSRPSGSAPGVLSVQPGYGESVTLPGPTTTDWLATTRSDLAVVRQKAGLRPLSGPQRFGGPAAAAAPSPFRVSWTGGAPEQSHVDASNWLVVRPTAGGPAGGFELVVSRPAAQGSLVIYGGAIGASGTVELLIDGRRVDRVALGVESRGSRVGVRWTSRPAQEVRLRFTAGAAGGVALAAAVLS